MSDTNTNESGHRERESGVSILRPGQSTLAPQVGDVGPRYSEWSADAFDALFASLTAAYDTLRETYDALDAYEIHDALLDVPEPFAAALGRYHDTEPQPDDSDDKQARRDHVRRVLTRGTSGYNRVSSEQLASAYADVLTHASERPAVVFRLDGPAWTALEDRRTAKRALDLFGELAKSVDVRVMASPRLVETLRRHHSEWCDEHLTDTRDSSPHGPSPTGDSRTKTRVGRKEERERARFEAYRLLEEWGAQTGRVRLLADLPRTGARTVSELKDDPVLDLKPATVDRYVGDLEAEGLVTVERRTTQSNAVALTPLGEAGQECIDPGNRLIHPAQTEIQTALLKSTSSHRYSVPRQQGREGGEGDSPDRTAATAATPHTLWAHLADTGTPDADSGAGFIQWLGDEGRETSAYALQKTLRAGRRVEGVTCVDAPVEQLDDGRVVYLSALDSELHVVTQWGGSAATVGRIAKALASEHIWGKLLREQDVGREFEQLDGMAGLSKSERIDHLQRGGQVGWSFHEEGDDLDYWSLRDRLHAIGCQVLDSISAGRDGDAAQKSAHYRATIGLITTMTRLLDLAGIDVTIYPLVPDVDQLTRDEEKRRDLTAFFRHVAPKQAVYGIHSAWRNVGETREEKLQFRKSMEIGGDPTASLTASWVVAGPGADTLQSHLAAALESVDVRDAVAEGHEDAIAISIPVVEGNGYGAVRAVVEDLLARKGHHGEAADIRRLTRVLMGVLGTEAWHCSPFAAARALLAIGNGREYRHTLSVADIEYGLSTLPAETLLPNATASTSRMVRALLASDEPLSEAELADAADCSKRTVSRNLEALLALAFVEDAGGQFVAHIEPWWATECERDEPFEAATPELRTTWSAEYPEDFLLEIALQRGVELSMVEWSDPPSTPEAIADTIEWLDPWVPWIQCLLEAPPAVDDLEGRGVVVTLGSPTAVDVATGTQSTLAV